MPRVILEEPPIEIGYGSLGTSTSRLGESSLCWGISIEAKSSPLGPEMCAVTGPLKSLKVPVGPSETVNLYTDRAELSDALLTYASNEKPWNLSRRKL